MGVAVGGEEGSPQQSVFFLKTKKIVRSRYLWMRHTSPDDLALFLGTKAPETVCSILLPHVIPLR